MRCRDAFTLLELLVVMAIITVLIGLLLPALLAARSTTAATQCLARQRQIGMAVQLYAQDHRNLFPRSTHSALAYNQMPWGYALSPYLGHQDYSGPGADWDRLFQTHYRCPSDPRKDRWSYGKSVWFELTAGETGEVEAQPLGPTFPTLLSIPGPSATVMFGDGDVRRVGQWLHGGSHHGPFLVPGRLSGSGHATTRFDQQLLVCGWSRRQSPF